MAARPRHPLLLAPLLLLVSAGRALAGGAPAAPSPLPEDEKRWLEDYVAPIILPDEKKLFLQLTEPHQREVFKKDFWARREREGLAPPLGPGYEQRYAQLRQIAATQYDGIGSDAGRMVVRRGEPDAVTDLTSDCSEVFRQAEVWTYRAGQGGRQVRHLFYRPSFGGPRKLWLPGDQAIFQTASCMTSFDQACARDPRTGAPIRAPGALCGGKGTTPPTCPEACEAAGIANEVETRGAALESAAAAMPPEVSTEGLDKLKEQFAALPTTGAKPLSVSNVLPASSLQQQTAAPAPAVATPPLTEKQRLAALPDEERKWLDEFVAPIILPEEKKVFLELTEPYQREQFKLAFWERRETTGLPQPLGPGYRYRYEELRSLADSKYDGWRSDAGRMVLRWGEPSDIFEPKGCQETFRDLEVWTYTNTGNSGLGTRKFIFYRPVMNAPRRLWNVATRDSDVFLPNSCRKSFDELARDCQPALVDNCRGQCQDLCEVYKAYVEVKARQGGSGASAAIEEASIFKPVEISTEGLEQMRTKWATTGDAAAKKLSVEGPSGSTAPQTAAGAKPSAPAPARRKLSNKEVKELTAKLSQKYKDFLELVDLIITKDEKEVFLQIGDDYQKDHFIEAFWKRRSLDSQGLRTDFQRTYTQRVEVAKEQFKNLHNDRAKIFIINGAPDAVIPIDCTDIYVPIQIWYWERLEALKSKTYLIFYQPMGMGEYKLWVPLDGQFVLQAGGVAGLSGAQASRRVDITRCPDWRTVQQAISYSTAALGSGVMSMIGQGKLFQPPTVETEGVDQILSMTTDMSAGAAPLGVTKLVRFPELRANKIGVDLSLLVPRSELKPRSLGEENFYNVDVIGEVVKGDRLIDNFKYRFDFPVGEVSSDKIPLTVRRYLYPGDYKLVLKVSDGNQSAEGRISEKLTVPEQPDPPSPAELAARAQGRGTIDKARETGLVPSSITLLPVAREIVTGLQRFETKVAESIRAVDFYLNGAKVMTKTRPPFDADLNMGPLPRKQTIRVVGYGETGRAVGEDEYTVNEGKEVFRVRVMSPMKGARVAGPTKVVAAVVVPEGKTLQKMEFYSNETRVATLYQPPFEQTVNIRDTKGLGYVRVVGTLDDGTVAEDLRYVNAPAYISEVSVDAVELYTTVTEHGRPVAGLQASNFKIFEDGAIQKIEQFDYVKNLPLTVGVMIDTSASMLESLPDASQAALGFLDYSLGEKDRAFTVSFDNEPYLLTKMTNRKDRIFRSLAGLRAEGSTALYDAIVYGLYQFSGVKGKKALVLLTDGKDTASKFDFDTTLEYVRKSGISIYAIGLKISGAELDVKYKLNKMAQVTGGQTFYVDSARNLTSVYKQINEELRSQYLLTYYSTNTAAKDKWRKVEVKVEPSNLQARTLSGYYP
jgi:Ca-activated chloride channel family protein